MGSSLFKFFNPPFFKKKKRIFSSALSSSEVYIRLTLFCVWCFVVWSLLWRFKRQGLLCLPFGGGSSSFWWRWWERAWGWPVTVALGRSGPTRQQENKTTLSCRAGWEQSGFWFWVSLCGPSQSETPSQCTRELMAFPSASQGVELLVWAAVHSTHTRCYTPTHTSASNSKHL